MPLTPIARAHHDESGFTLTELLAAMVIGSLILTALMYLFSTSLMSTFRTTDRVEATQRGRQAVDRAITALNSQICVFSGSGTANPPIVDGQNTQVTFYANLGNVTAEPQQYRLRYDAAARSLYEDRWVGTRNATGDLVFPSAPTASRILGDELVPATPGQPIFTYQRFVTSGSTAGTIDPVLIPTPLTAAARNEAVRVNVTIAAQPQRLRTQDLRSTTIEASATVGSSDSATPNDGVNC